MYAVTRTWRWLCFQGVCGEDGDIAGQPGPLCLVCIRGNSQGPSVCLLLCTPVAVVVLFCVHLFLMSVCPFLLLCMYNISPRKTGLFVAVVHLCLCFMPGSILGI